MNAVDARTFADEWVASWNAHDLDRILSHYSETAELLSPVAAKRLGNGRVVGHGALRSYWSPALADGSVLHFSIVEVFAGSSAVTIVYDAILPADLGNRRGAETFELGPDRKVVRSMACYSV
jgi:hypothetical protein